MSGTPIAMTEGRRTPAIPACSDKCRRGKRVAERSTRDSNPLALQAHRA